ncbi:hypothetical protein [Flavobacterium algoritolerans]|uniref:Uncharacterized protein n=1 Tax=Flavobacterium algoritolerans TaxID=3041254 RepID=A0ABT6VBA2_9FLAO|nr:hypothetical protein [Flavobacterium algoritolerans]MDI5895514.1 hypothetical protein [Flavobacterium algoritolerans]
MKAIKYLMILLFSGTIVTVQAQEGNVKSETNINVNSDQITYYQQRGSEDANYELTFKAKTKVEEKAFWKEQKEYEKDLKKKNRKAYRAYIASKQDVYTMHHSYCDIHCHHSDSFYGHARFYYYEYDQRNYQRRPSNTSVNAQIGVRAPSLRLGLF